MAIPGGPKFEPLYRDLHDADEDWNDEQMYAIPTYVTREDTLEHKYGANFWVPFRKTNLGCLEMKNTAIEIEDGMLTCDFSSTFGIPHVWKRRRSGTNTSNLF